ncbi:MAG TPA: hypothetical protein VFZ66_24490 [Herpetosiphonaceae bacterium]
MPEDKIDAGVIRESDLDGGTQPGGVRELADAYREASKRAFALDLFYVVLVGAGVLGCALAASGSRRR